MSARTSLVLERLLPAAVGEVYAAWLDPDVLRDWMSPEGHAEAEVDARVGGSFRIVMVGPEMRIEHTGEYLELEPPRRLSFTWRSPYAGDAPSVVTVTLSPREGGTLLRLMHERLPAEAVEGHEGGWGRILGRLSAVLSGEEVSS